MKPITLYNHAAGPNPKKVIIVMEELGIPFEKIDIADPKADTYTVINPNGRLPAIVDPNTDLTLWESDAILEYLVDTYDKEGLYAVENPNDKWLLKQYLYFQASGQGPYFGQLIYFTYLEKNEAAVKRYVIQADRVFMVLNNILEGKTYLVAEKCTHADISFISWSHTVLAASAEEWGKLEVETKYPNFWAWHSRLMERPSVKKVVGSWS